MDQLADQQCRICGATCTLSLTMRDANGYDLYQCSCCGTELVHESLEPDDVKEIYDQLFDQGGYDKHRLEFETVNKNLSNPPYSRYRRHLLARLGRLVRGRRMLEIGGGVGAFGITAERSGWSYVGYDISEVAVRYSRRLGLESNVFDPDEPPKLEAESFDAVVMWEVVEHIGEVHRYLKAIHEYLAPGGVLLMSTPNASRDGYRESWKYKSLSSPPIHINFFTTEALSNAVRSAGFADAIPVHRRIHIPEMNRRSMVYHARILVGLSPAKSIHLFAVR